MLLSAEQVIKLPEGMRDVIFDEAANRRLIEKKLTEVYENAGYGEVITPALEYGEVFSEAVLSMGLKEMYKLSDMSGALTVLRADNTMPMARVAATKLQSEALPLKLYYNQDIYRINSEHSGHRNEIRQSGVEFIGACGKKSDLLIMTRAIEALRTIGLNFKLEIGHVGYYNAIINSLTLDENEQDRIRELVDSKNTVSLGLGAADPRLDKIRRVPLLFGDESVFAEAKALADGNEEALSALNYLKELYDLLEETGLRENVTIDMGIVHSRDYYTGVVFRGYIEGAGEPVLAGGRYDMLLNTFGRSLPATGFAVNVGLVADSVAKAGMSSKEKTPDAIIHFSEKSYVKALKLRESMLADGSICVLSTFDDIAETTAYADECNIKKVIEINGDKVTEVRA